MKVSETPNSIEELDLMRQLKAYADGQATWSRDGSCESGKTLGRSARTYTTV